MYKFYIKANLLFSHIFLCLFFQVINAALTLAARPQSKVAQDNMDVFKDQWEKQVRILTEAVDDITSVDDFLSVSGLWQYRAKLGHFIYLLEKLENNKYHIEIYVYMYKYTHICMYTYICMCMTNLTRFS